MKKSGTQISWRRNYTNSWRPSWSARRKCVRQFVWFVAAPAASLICHAIIFESQTSSICTHTTRLYIITVRAKFHTRSRTGSCWFGGLRRLQRQTKNFSRHRSSWKISSPSCDGFARVPMLKLVRTSSFVMACIDCAAAVRRARLHFLVKTLDKNRELLRCGEPQSSRGNFYYVCTHNYFRSWQQKDGSFCFQAQDFSICFKKYFASEISLFALEQKLIQNLVMVLFTVFAIWREMRARAI